MKLPGQAVDRPTQPLRQQHPPQPPPGHRERLGERVHDDRFPRRLPRTAQRLPVADPVVDLVADQLNPVGRTPRARSARRRPSSRSDSAGLATITPLSPGSSISTVGWNRVSGPHGNSTTSHPSASQDVAVGRIPRPRQRDPVARVEGSQERQRERPGRPGRHHHVVGRRRRGRTAACSARRWPAAARESPAARCTPARARPARAPRGSRTGAAPGSTAARRPGRSRRRASAAVARRRTARP